MISIQQTLFIIKGRFLFANLKKFLAKVFVLKGEAAAEEMILLQKNVAVRSHLRMHFC